MGSRQGRGAGGTGDSGKIALVGWDPEAGLRAAKGQGSSRWCGSGGPDFSLDYLSPSRRGWRRASRASAAGEVDTCGKLLKPAFVS